MNPQPSRTVPRYLGRPPGHRANPRARYGPSERAPGYDQAEATLRALPDLGIAALEAARAALGDGTPLEQLVIHAAAHPVRPAAPLEAEPPATAAAAAPSCTACGTALEPDNTCWTCTTETR